MKGDWLKKKLVFGAIAIVIIIGIIFFLYFFVLSPSFVTKPNIPKPTLVSADEIKPENINWALNEVGAYKLHSSMYFFGEPAVIESVVTDKGQVFSTTITNNYPTTTQGPAINPDIRFTMDSQSFTELYANSDILSKAKEMQKAGLVNIEILKDEAALAAKGYKVIYDSMKSD